jgi:hypothetical protein
LNILLFLQKNSAKTKSFQKVAKKLLKSFQKVSKNSETGRRRRRRFVAPRPGTTLSHLVKTKKVNCPENKKNSKKEETTKKENDDGRRAEETWHP